ncbi:hypothetical protein R75461_07753 [Paraburkholderia nemoris]|uniref:YqaJ viral recombinase family nuclease n=1 Tax=Paraburkholderia nemoris TaxID=2793076 RepID=UPI00190CE8FF|nr:MULTISPECIES: YqaJ viral recombinase family protein [Paraburkholderia]MBK3786548.1 endonuclease [Paraburkholderia aspalathi]CAE6856763.1 hypothetical protein R75461_07753 [Paraburkholderia nemoris]
MDREAWLQARRTGIGGSDAGIVCGLHPFVAPIELYWDKVGEAPLEREDNERMQMGRALEDAIANVYAERFSVKLRRHSAMRRHPKYSWMIANPDRLIEGARIGVEIKNVDSLVFRFGAWGPAGSDEVPEPYFLQALHYAVVFDYPEWHIGALVGGNRLMRYIIRRDAEVESMLIDAEREFWERVQRREPPEIDYTRPGTIAILRHLYPGTNGETVALDPSMMDWHNVRVEADEQVKAYQAVGDGARAHILYGLGPAAIGCLPNGGEYRRRLVHRKGYEVAPIDYIDFRYVKPKGHDDE